MMQINSGVLEKLPKQTPRHVRLSANWLMGAKLSVMTIGVGVTPTIGGVIVIRNLISIPGLRITAFGRVTVGASRPGKRFLSRWMMM
jgi:hypothetical protein